MFKKVIAGIFLSGWSLLLGCQDVRQRSTVQAVDIDNSQIKWQSVDNCWVYATVGWIESLVLRSSGELRNYSESYLMYRYFQDQLLFTEPSRIETAGLWVRGQHIVKKYGLMLEGDFVPEEAQEIKSLRQKSALAAINNQLQDSQFRADLGALEGHARLDFVLDFLNQAFEIASSPDENLIIAAQAIQIERPDGARVSLSEELARWQLRYHNQSLFAWDDAGLTVDQLPALPVNGLDQGQLSLERQVIVALNRGEPVILEWFIDFNAKDQSGVFTQANLAQKGSGRQGYHQTVIEDYGATVYNAAGQVTDRIGAGVTDPARLEQAEKTGRLDFLIVKNSWGPSADSYSVDGVKGFHKLEMSYLHSWMKSKLGGTALPADTGLRGFILPGR